MSQGPETGMPLLGWNALENRAEVNMNGAPREIQEIRTCKYLATALPRG